jgi:ribose 5-phosphate isomerase B
VAPAEGDFGSRYARLVRIAVGSDHAGFELKGVLAAHLADAGHEVADHGTWSTDSVDYPDFGAAVARAVVEGHAELGVCVCGTGIGISIAANKVRGARAAVVHDVTSARLAREHNDANVVCFGGRLTTPTVACEAIDAFLGTSFQGGRHSRRLEKIAELERRPS